METTNKKKRVPLLKRVRNILNMSLASSEDEPEESIHADQVVNAVDPKDAKYISDAFQEINWDLSENLAIIPYFGKVGEVFQQHGFNDGAKGIEGNGYYHLSKTKVRGLVDDLKAMLIGQQKLLQTRMKGLKSAARNARKEFDESRKVLLRRSYHPRQFSLLLAWIYLVVALILVLADIPLAVKLMEAGFNLDFGTPGISELMEQPWAVIKGNWETLIMALGVALSSIFFKVLYDEFVSGPLSNWATLAQREPDIPSGDPGYEKDIRKAYRIRAVVKFIIFALTLGTIIILGIFRFQASISKGDLPVYMANWVTQFAFILITLLFPIVSGVCFSMGLDRFLNRGEYKRARKSIQWKRDRFGTATERYESTKSQLEKVESYIEWVRSEAFYRKYLDHLLACYAIGYERGQLTPESNMKFQSFFDMIWRMRRKIVSRQVFNSIHAANANGEESLLSRFEKMAAQEVLDEFKQQNNGNH